MEGDESEFNLEFVYPSSEKKITGGGSSSSKLIGERPENWHNSDMQWAIFNFPLQELREYDTFRPTPYFMKTYVPFFSQYAQVIR